MPAFAAAAIPFWSAAASGGAAIAGAKIASGGTNKAAKIQSDAGERAAQLQAKATADALAFQEKQAAQDRADWLASQRANFDQYANQERRLSSLGSMLGFGPRETPAMPSYLSEGGGSALPPSGLQEVYNSVKAKGGPTANSLDELAAAYTAKGHQVERPHYNGVPSGNELIVDGQKLKFTVGDVGQPNTGWYQWGTDDGGGAAAPRRPYAPYSLGGMVAPMSGSRIATPALQAPSPSSLAGMLRR